MLLLVFWSPLLLLLDDYDCNSRCSYCDDADHDAYGGVDDGVVDGVVDGGGEDGDDDGQGDVGDDGDDDGDDGVDVVVVGDDADVDRSVVSKSPQNRIMSSYSQSLATHAAHFKNIGSWSSLHMSISCERELQFDFLIFRCCEITPRLID